MADSDPSARLTAVLGPTNTGKTHLAIDRMLAHHSGMIGFPLRLLARENYDRVVARAGRSAAALITGEEKIIPARARYFLCTVEAMPTDRQVDFLAIDEIQMCGDPERGHIFTHRLIHARGRLETMMLGADTIRPLLRRLLPDARLESRPRLSQLRYSGVRKLTRLPRRSAVIAFSAADVYALAELIRRRRGGAAVVLGALSPRTRNAQVGMYQAGEVDYLVATDAIGMGLNMDIDHVAFAEDAKFDGRAPRRLGHAELAQIAGRAGRHMNDGGFGVTGDCPPFDPETVTAIETHRFEPLRALYWRNSRLSFASLRDLRRGLEARGPEPFLFRKRDAEDQQALEALARSGEVAERVTGPARVRLLWDVCQVPDFRKSLTDSHLRLLTRLFTHLSGREEVLPNDWIGEQMARFERTDGDIDTLVNRIAHIRTWTYISHRSDWIADPVHWQQTARAIEDKLSDALHDRLTQRFVDRRAAALARRLNDRDTLHGQVETGGAVIVEGHPVGRLEGLSFIPAVTDADMAKPVLTAARRVLPAELERRVRAIETAGEGLLSLSGTGAVVWGGHRIARLVRGHDLLAPDVRVLGSDLLSPDQRDRLRGRLRAWLAAHLRGAVPSLLRLAAADLRGPARGIAFQMLEGLGTARSEQLATLIRALDPGARRALGRLGLRFGVHSVYLPELLKPAAIAVRAMLWSVWHNRFPDPGPPPPGRVAVPRQEAVPEPYYRACGYAALGGYALRVDMVERLAVLVRRAGRAPSFRIDAAMLAAAPVPRETLAAILGDLGCERVAGEGAEALFTLRSRTRRARPGGGRAAAGNGGKPVAAAWRRDSPFAVLADRRTGA